MTLTESADKVTENFTGKELDDETLLSYHGARYLDPMLGVWISVDPKRFFSSPYLYMGNEYNPIVQKDTSGRNPVAGAVAAAPVAFYNLYQAEKMSYDNGEPYWQNVKAGLVAFGLTLAAGATLSPVTPITAMAYGAASSATTNVVGQIIIEGKSEIDVGGIAQEARNGALVSGMALFGSIAAESILMSETAEWAGGAAGTAAMTGIKILSEDEWPSQCTDE